MTDAELQLRSQSLVWQRCEICGFVAESYISDQEMCSDMTAALFANADVTTNFVLQRHLTEAHKVIL